ncbi:glycoside hydrolase family 127 protein [Pedobacter psychroterrae]|uniref:Glycoside hydrolase family 127 protein n=1 Tax=Pedobacter psychroterrae TaxID=2530453 RepID=A0A4R0NC49_9SPHI|nr:beta-L-arabinofuranosidase domain-containing protein [Pedobacter psychroterrae]TCC96863.1 glycoside hydrolase family 127 protein [Pedobacter psychroterrae]
MNLRLNRVALVALSCVVAASFSATAQHEHSVKIIKPLTLEQVRVNDPFWSPKLKVWTATTVYDVFDKLEGKYTPDRPDIIAEKKKLGRTRNAFLNFDLVAQGKKDIKSHDGPPWYDGLVYESIRGAADILAEYPDKALEAKIDGYIDRIAAAQAIDPDGYVNTYTTLTRSKMRWGTNGGDDNWQHDIYNAGMLIEAADHYYRATGKTKLLEAAVKIANLMSRDMGPAPRKNIVPGHGGPEEAVVKLYWLFKNDPALKAKIKSPVKEQDYFDLGKFWIENRGNHGGKDGAGKRMNFGAYGQDDVPVFQQKTIEGHAVRATLLATGVAAVALENKNRDYVNTANTYWDNMVGKKMFITGGEGAIREQEKFGPNYFLPESAYLETCAAISSGFFSARMNELQADGKYMDEFERVLYNNLLSGVALSGDHYYYENPLVATDHKRWAWHDCPCCPPMILKMIGSAPEYIYAGDEQNIYVNLFIGSEATVKIEGMDVLLEQTTNYPWQGDIKISVKPAQEKTFSLKVRIPGWATGKENPFDLYLSKISQAALLKINGEAIAVSPVNGYVTLTRKWKKGDVVELRLPVEPRFVTPNASVETIKGKLAIAAGPIVYGLESGDNPSLGEYKIIPETALTMTYQPKLLNGVNVITGQAVKGNGEQVRFQAVPFYSLGNRKQGDSYQVWTPLSAGKPN